MTVEVITANVSESGRFARAVVLRLLDRLTGGRVHVVDQYGEACFGTEPAPHASRPIDVTVQVHDPRTYSRMVKEGSVGLGESYADGWWDTDDLCGLLRVAHRSVARTHTARDAVHRWLRPVLDAVDWRPRGDKERDARNIRAHYDLGNEFFQRILDETMMYSCAVFERPSDSLADASVHKLDRLANLLALEPDDRVLEIGTGWGGFAVHAATHYGCHVTTTTISPSQYEFARRRVDNAGLQHRVTVLRDDYRDVEGTFDKIVAIEMIEAVHWSDYDTFFGRCRRLLDDAGALAMQAIVVPDASFDRVKRHTDFIKSAIFPGGCLPSVHALGAAASRHGFVPTYEDDIGLHYAETLRRWKQNLADARAELDALGLDRRFARLWEFYFSYCEAAFEERYVRDVQLLYTPPGWRPAAMPAAQQALAVRRGGACALVRK
ncbi:MAG TPA: cyclopropane-fatty-acyl-phospholipid synthase family protein [Acidimicrobiia bacterium]